MWVQVRKSLRDSVKDIIHKVGVTSILVTHDQEEAFDIADKVVIFNRCAAHTVCASDVCAPVCLCTSLPVHQSVCASTCLCSVTME